MWKLQIWNWHNFPKATSKGRLYGTEDKLRYKNKSLRMGDISPPKDDFPSWKWGHIKIQHYLGRWYEVLKNVIIICSPVTTVNKKKKGNQYYLNVYRGKLKNT